MENLLKIFADRRCKYKISIPDITILIMTPEEKAKELVMKYFNLESEAVLYIDDSKQCAVIAVDEIIDAIKVFHNGAEWVLYESMGWKFWQKVKEQINQQ